MPWTPYEYANVTNFYEMILYANDTTNSFFGNGLVFSIWAVLFIIFRRTTRSDMIAFGGANLVTLLVCSILWSINLIDEMPIIVLGLLTGLSVIFMSKDWSSRSV